MYFVITNIPVSFRTPEIRNFFSDLIEKGAFKCFHFRHRPEKQFLKSVSKEKLLKPLENCTTNAPDGKQGVNPDNENKSNSTIPLRPKPKSHWMSSGLSGLSSLITQSKAKAYVETQNKLAMLSTKKDTNQDISGNQNSEKSLEEGIDEEEYISDANCCILEVKPGFESKLINVYNNKHWVDKNGDLNPTKCVISKMIIEDYPDNNLSISGNCSEFYITSSKIATMIEFIPPSSMPEGNIGTPTSFFRDQMKSCQLPASFISKLGLEFTLRKGKKRFGQVPFDYGTEVCAGKKRNNEDHVVFTAKGHLIPSTADFKVKSKMKQLKKSSLKKKRPQIELEKEAEEGAELEEWERYESYHDNVTSQERAKERVYEEEIEQVWEKGGSGLNFWTDAQYWRQQEGEFDEKTADEWDVDMSGYYEEGAGDFDARTSLSMLESNQVRAGRNISVFKKPSQPEVIPKKKKKRKEIGPLRQPAIGAFESHTLGFGRRLMESQGWTDGQGLGRTGREGILDALGNDGQHPQDKMGLGYHGEKWSGFERRVRAPQASDPGPSNEERNITTAFDNKSQVNIQTNIHHDNHSAFVKEKYHRSSKLVSTPPCLKAESTIPLPFSGWGTLQRSESAKSREENERATRLIVNPDQEQHCNWTHKLVDPQLYKKHWADKLVNGAKRIKISTVFDDPKEEDPPTPHLRTAEPTKMSHRPIQIAFVRSSQEET